MTILATMAVVAALQGGWTWTLYEGGGPLVLAHEIPDTPQLKTVFECAPRSGMARMDLYGATDPIGVATLRAGRATASSESEAATDHRSIMLRTDHPVFGQFVVTGTLDVSVGGRHDAVVVEAAHLAKLRRFAELCGG